MFNRVLVVAALCITGFIGGFVFLGGGGAAEEASAPIPEVVETGVPNLCEQAVDSATMVTLSRGHSPSSHRGPTLVASNGAGNCVATFDDREPMAPIEVRFFWNGEHLNTIPVDPKKESDVWGLIYTYDVIFRADGTHEVITYDPIRQTWWCGVKIGECNLTTGDAFFSTACLEASKDPGYLETYKPGSGPACVAHTYEKLPSGEVVIVD